MRRKALTFNFVIKSNFIKPQQFYGWERVRINQLIKSCPYLLIAYSLFFLLKAQLRKKSSRLTWAFLDAPGGTCFEPLFGESNVGITYLNDNSHTFFRQVSVVLPIFLLTRTNDLSLIREGRLVSIVSAQSSYHMDKLSTWPIESIVYTLFAPQLHLERRLDTSTQTYW